MDSVYFHDGGTTLTVNLFLPSVLDWTQRGITVTQTTSYPADDTTTLKVTGGVGGTWSMRVRIPGWTSGATLSVNGVAQSVTASPGTYATLTRSWASGDTVTVKLPMRVALQAANDSPGVAAITYGPAVLAGNYGSTKLSSLPALDASSITRTSSTSLAFTATADGTKVGLAPFHDAQGFNYTVYWRTDTPGFRLVNAASGLVLGIRDMSTADGGLALQWADSGTADHNWLLLVDGTALRLRNLNSGKVLGVKDMSTADNAPILQWADTGTPDHRWTVVDAGNGYHKLQNVHTGKLLGIEGGATANGAAAVQVPDTGASASQWQFVPDGARRIQSVASGRVLGVRDMSTADGGLAVQWDDNGTADHLWTAVVDTGGHLRLRNSHSGKVLAVENGGTANGARIVQWADNGTADHRWRLRHGGGDTFKIQCANSRRVLGVLGASTGQGAQAVLWDDNGTNDHLWRFI